MLVLTEYLQKMDIAETSAPAADANSLRLFQILRTKLPTGLCVLMQGREITPWSEIKQLLQVY